MKNEKQLTPESRLESQEKVEVSASSSMKKAKPKSIIAGSEKKRLTKDEKKIAAKLRRDAYKELRKEERVNQRLANQVLRKEGQKPLRIPKRTVMPLNLSPTGIKKIFKEVPSGEKQTVVLDVQSYNTQFEEKELVMGVNQISRCYNFNKTSTSGPVRLIVSKMSEQVKECFDNKMPGYLKWGVLSFSDKEFQQQFTPNQIVYITNDSPYVLTNISNTKVYVIRALADSPAGTEAMTESLESMDIPTARLPIAEHVHLVPNYILKINQTFDILLKYRESYNWIEAIESVIPKKCIVQSKSN